MNLVFSIIIVAIILISLSVNAESNGLSSDIAKEDSLELATLLTDSEMLEFYRYTQRFLLDRYAKYIKENHFDSDASTHILAFNLEGNRIIDEFDDKSCIIRGTAAAYQTLFTSSQISKLLQYHKGELATYPLAELELSSVLEEEFGGYIIDACPISSQLTDKFRVLSEYLTYRDIVSG